MRTRADEFLGNRQRIKEAATHRLHIECCGTLVAELVLQQAGGTWENEIWGRGCDNDQVNVGGRNPGHFHRPLTRNQGEIAGGLPRLCQMAGTNTGA